MLKISQFTILLLLVSFGSMSAVLFTPALPELARDFNVSESAAQWTMTIFLFAYTLGQLPYGPIANRFGRKKAIYIGIVLAFIGTSLSFFAETFAMLCIGRFIQALGSAVGLKITFTMIADQLSGASATKAISMMGLAFAIMPGLGVAVGGFLTVTWGWPGCFAFIGLYSIVLAFLCLFLPETAKHLDREALQIGKIFHAYGRQFRNPFTVLYALLMGLSTSTFYIFAAVAPYIGIEQMGLSPDLYGLWNIVPALGLVVGIFLTDRISPHLNPSRAILLGIGIIFFSAFSMGLCFSLVSLSAFTLFLPMFLMRLGNMLSWSNASSAGLSEATDKSHASAVIQFINLAMGTLGTYLVGIFSPQYLFLLPLSFGIVSFFMLILWLKLPTPKAG